MEAHDLIGFTHERPAYEHGRGAPEPQEGMFHLPTLRDPLKLVNCGVDPELAEEDYDSVAHVARALAEYQTYTSD